MQKYASIENDGSVKFEREFPNGLEEVYSFLIDGDKRGLWLASGEMPEKPGEKFKLIFQHRNLSQEEDPAPNEFEENADGEIVEGKILKITAPDFLSFTWSRNSIVSFELKRDEDLTHLYLIHKNLARNRENLIGICARWHTHLNILSDRLEKLEPKSFWAVYRKLEEEYSSLITS